MLVKLFTSVTGERCVNVGSKSVRRLKLFRFPRLLGWARFHSTCHSGISRNLWSKPGLEMCRITVTSTSSSTSSLFCTDEMWTRVISVNWRTTPKTGNEIRHFRQPPSGQPIRTEDVTEFVGCSCTWLMKTNFDMVMTHGDAHQIGPTDEQLLKERSLACQDSGLLTFRTISFTFSGRVWTLLWREHYYCIVPVETVVNIICPVDFSEYSVN